MTAPTLPVPDLPFARDVIDFAGARVTVMGLGSFGGGVAVTRFLIRAGAHVTVTDLRAEADLADSLADLEGLAFEAHLGGHEAADFTGADVVVVNPAVPPTSPYLRQAADAGVRLESETNIVFKRSPARIVGVTGSNGKSTTTKLVSEILATGARRVWLGGNIGRPLVEHLDAITADDLVVMELSSFQLDHISRIGRGPSAAVITNLAPNHIEWHGSMPAYAAAKRAILGALPRDGFAVLNADDETVRTWADEQSSFFSLHEEAGQRGAFLSGEHLVWRDGAEETAFPISPAEVPLPGRHNLANVLAALAVGRLMGIDDAASADAVRHFESLPDRLEIIAERGGIRYCNDSIATTPESAICGLRAFERPLVLIAGGYDKHVPLEGLAEAIVALSRVVVTTGATGDQIADLVEARRSGADPLVLRRPAFDDAVAAAVEAARPGDVVLLSPGCASYGQFRNYRERAARFRALVVERTGDKSHWEDP